jgi:hypothetical protein
LAVSRIAGCLQLLRQALPGKKHAFAFPVAFLLVGRDRYARRLADGLPLLRPFLLLLFDGLTLPPARHLKILL